MQKSKPLVVVKSIVLKPVIDARFFISFEYKGNTRIS